MAVICFRKNVYRVFIQRIRMLRLRRYMYARQALLISCGIFTIWVLYDAFHLGNPNLGLGEWTIKRPVDKQACVHPQMPLRNPNIMQYLKKVRPIQCTEQQDWVYTKKGRVFISTDATFGFGAVSCTMTSMYMADDDFKLAKGKPVPLVNGSLLKYDTFTVKCESDKGHKYENLHFGLTRRKDVIEKTKTVDMKGNEGLNVVFWGFDSMSSLMVQRLLPRFHDYFVNTLGAIHLEGYNIVGDGTPQAFIPILTGSTEGELPDVRKGENGSSFVDVYPFIWKEYETKGYITHYTEDEASIGTFQHRMNGFKSQPTHHYMRPFYIELPKYMSPFYLPFDNRPSRFCIGSRPRPKLMLDWIIESFETYQDILKFIVFFNAELTHEYNSLSQLYEPYLLEFLEEMKSKNYLNNTVLIIMSDHGARFNRMRATEQGKVEERLPYFTFRFPEWFHNVYPEKMKNFIANSQRLTTPFDVYETLLELANNFQSKDRNKKTHGISLFDKIPLERTCQQAYIEPHWCACLSWEHVPNGNKDVMAAADNIIRAINNILSPRASECETLTLDKIKSASKFSTNSDVLKYRQAANKEGSIPDLGDNMQVYDVLYLVTFSTKPRMGMFEATARKRASDGKFVTDISQISRINKYGDASWCMLGKATRLLPYCVCKQSRPS